MATLIFKNKALADTILKEIAVTPEGTIFWAGQANPDFLFDSEVNVVSYNIGADGRCAVGHPLGEVDLDFFEAYCEKWIVSGDMVILPDGLPEDWVYQTEEVI